MSTVLWANHLKDGVVESDESDKFSLYKFLDKLDSICEKLDITRISAACDATDFRVNLEELELPEGMASTDELMAQSGAWLDAEDAVHMLETLLSTVTAENIRFGIVKNHHQEVVAELEESIAYAKAAAQNNARFNCSIVM